MRRNLSRSTWALLVVSGTALAVTVAVDEDSMQLIDDRNKGLASSIALKDAATAKDDARELAAMFATVESFYAQKGTTPDAVDWAKQSRERAEEISQRVAASDFDEASRLAVALSKTCKSCHAVYGSND